MTCRAQICSSFHSVWKQADLPQDHTYFTMLFSSLSERLQVRADMSCFSPRWDEHHQSNQKSQEGGGERQEEKRGAER